MNKDLRPEEMASLFAFFTSFLSGDHAICERYFEGKTFSLEFLNSSKRFYRAVKASVY